jgi:hypothetical protein
MSPKTSSEPFKRRKELSKQHSDNPKTVRNRMNETGKAGLDAAFLRADTAFRTAKCRNLAKLHNGPNWSAMSPRQKAAAEATIVKKLEAKRDKRKREHELEWRYKAEKGLIHSDEEEPTRHKKPRSDESKDTPDLMEIESVEDLIVTDDDDDAWSDCDGDEDELLMIGEEVVEIYKRYDRQGALFVGALGTHAHRQEREYAIYKARKERAEVSDNMEVD